MAVYVDDVRHRYGRMFMCHMWADHLNELLRMADHIGVDRKWLQQPPKASWVHFDISLTMKSKALEAGAILTDKFGPVEYEARRLMNSLHEDWRQRGQRMLANVERSRELRARSPRVPSPLEGEGQGEGSEPC